MAKRISPQMLSIYYSAVRYLHVVALIAMTLLPLLVLLHVSMRYVFRSPLWFSEELSIILMMVVVFAAIPELFVRDQHFVVTIMSHSLPDKVRHWTTVGVTAVAFLFVSVLTWYATRLAIIFYVRNIRYELLAHVPKWPMFALPALCSLLVSIFMLIHLVKLLKQGKGQVIQGGREEEE